ncbi:MAG: OmpA family protein, partial [Myxococcota bacterium]
MTGHTDSTASASYNQNLSQARANSVASVLRQGGV